MIAVTCKCGASHSDPSSLEKRGWEALGGGRASFFVKCRCGSLLAVKAMTDARLCDFCRRLITGRDGDVKVCIVERDRDLVLCQTCFHRSESRHGWLEWRLGFACRPMLTDELMDSWGI